MSHADLFGWLTTSSRSCRSNRRRMRETQVRQEVHKAEQVHALSAPRRPCHLPCCLPPCHALLSERPSCVHTCVRQLLKLVQTPEELLETTVEEMSKDKDAAAGAIDLQKILELKGLKKAEMDRFVDVLDRAYATRNAARKMLGVG